MYASTKFLKNYVLELYDITHSIIIAFFFIFIVYYFFNKNFAFAMLAWPLHILLDFPFHTVDFFPTPILWPVVEVKFDGVSWSKPVVWFSNVGGIVLLYIYRYTIQNKTKKLKKIIFKNGFKNVSFVKDLSNKERLVVI